MPTPVILIIGATGSFGRRLVVHLARTPDLTLQVGSRTAERAQALVAQVRARPETRAALLPVSVTTASALTEQFATLRPTIVIDCSGPFQGMDYRVARAALAAGAHFVDLADARDYLLGFYTALDAEFRARGLVALAGASSSPALSAAVLAELTAGWRRVDHIDIAIVPGGRSEVGEAAVAGALSYCGARVPVVEGGEAIYTMGWGNIEQVWLDRKIKRAVAAVETADAELLVRRYRDAASIRFRAGLESHAEQTGLWLLAQFKRAGLIRRPERFARPLSQARKLTRLFTSTTGGMIVRVSGLDGTGAWTAKEWHLIARKNDGLHVPPSPAIAAVRAILRGDIAPGARPALDLPLGSIEAELQPYAIETKRYTATATAGLMQQTIGEMGYANLPKTVQAYHLPAAPVIWTGCADVTAGRNVLTRLIAKAFGLPASAPSVPVKVVTERWKRDEALAPTEIWTRYFAGQRFFSVMEGLEPGKATERFPPFTFDLGLAEHEGRLIYPVTGWRLGGLRLPRVLAPRSIASEWQDTDGRFCFDVQLSLPLLGLLAHYRGWLLPLERDTKGAAQGEASPHAIQTA